MYNTPYVIYHIIHRVVFYSYISFHVHSLKLYYYTYLVVFSKADKN